MFLYKYVSESFSRKEFININLGNFILLLEHEKIIQVGQ